MGDDMQTYRDANLHTVWVDASDEPVGGGRVSTAWMVVIVGLVLFWAGAAAAVLALV